MALSDLSDDTIPLSVKAPQIQGLDLGSIYKTSSEVQSNQAYAANAQSEVQRRTYDLMSDQLGRAAQDIIQQPDGPAKTDRWNQYVSQFHQKGYLTDQDAQRYYNNPSDIVLHQAIAHSMQVAQYRGMTGQTAGAEAQAAAPYEFHQANPSETSGYFPTPGGPPAGGPASAVPKATPKTTPVNANPDGTPQNDLFKDNPFYKEAPVVPIGPQMPKGPGIVNSGISPAAAQAQEQGLKEYQDEISPAINAAAHTQAELGSMKSELQSGKVSTSRLAELKQTVGGYIYGVLQGSEGADKAASDAKSILGIDVPWSEVFTKDSTRMGLTFARQTEGAREAVQAIKIALGANPSLMNTSQGNLKIIDIMNQGANYDLDRGQAATNYMAKQQDGPTGVPHLVGFDNWFANAHSPAQYVSKAVPYQVPRMSTGTVDDTNLKNGVTYDLPGGRKGVWNNSTKSMSVVPQ